MRYYCTYFDRFYLLRALALYRSLKAQSPPFLLWALCFDTESYEVLRQLDLPDLRPLSLAMFEEGDQELLAAKQNRSRVEYYFTCTPSLPIYILSHCPQVDLITYLDADLFFYADPKPIFEELGAGSVLIVEHRFPPSRPEMLGAGIYNVGWVTFRRDASGLECLGWWRERCLEWCCDRMEAERFADQKYLDDWPERFRGVVVLQHKGAGLAPWNWMNYDIQSGRTGIKVDGATLIFFHFHGLKIFSPWLYDPVAEGRVYGEMPVRLRWRLYPPYLQQIKQTARWVRQTVPKVRVLYIDIRTQGYDWRKLLRKVVELRLIPTVGIR